VKRRNLLALAVVIGMVVPNTAFCAGSLAARVQAAQAARREQAIPLTAPHQASQDRARRETAPTAENVPRQSSSATPASSRRSSSGRLNIADWLNGDATIEPTSPPDKPPRLDVPGTNEPPAEPPAIEPATEHGADPSADEPVKQVHEDWSQRGENAAASESNPRMDLLELMAPEDVLNQLEQVEREPSLRPEARGYPDTGVKAFEPAPEAADGAPRSSAPVNEVPLFTGRAQQEEMHEDGRVAKEELAEEEVSEEENSEGDSVRQRVGAIGSDEANSDEANGNAHAGTDVEVPSDVDLHLAPDEDVSEEAERVEPPKQFSPQMLRIRDRNRMCLSYYYQRPESVNERSPWGVMHTLIAFGVDTQLIAGRQRVNAIGWLCYNRPCRGYQLFTFDGRYPVPRNGPGFQGHEGQFLHMLALSRVKSTYPMRVDGHELTVQDLIAYEKATCRPKSELTFKLIALSHYLPSDATWTSKWGDRWSIPRLIQEELAQPIKGACCGGTHRLIGYSMAVKVRRRRNEPLDGQWLRAHKYVDSYHKYVIKLQNRDGSFSTNWLEGRGVANDLDRRIQTTGHVLEWLVFSLPEEELTDRRIVSAVNYLCSMMLNYRQKEWEIGPRGHALRALALYNERVFGDKPGQRRELLARRPR